jgi:DNA recombination-dependent growth factor C
MGVIDGTISVRRYCVKGELPLEVRARFLKALRAHSFAPIDPNSDERQSVGWVNAEDPEDADLKLAHVFFGDILVAAMKVETLKAPPAEVKRQLKQRAREMEAETGNPLGRRELRLLKITIEKELRSRILPKYKVVDMAWDVANHALDGSEGQLYLWSTSKGHNETFLDLFAKTFGKSFGLDINPVGPGSMAHDYSEEPVDPTRELLFGFQGVRVGVLSEGSESDSEEG